LHSTGRRSKRQAGRGQSGEDARTDELPPERPGIGEVMRIVGGVPCTNAESSERKPLELNNVCLDVVSHLGIELVYLSDLP